MSNSLSPSPLANERLETASRLRARFSEPDGALLQGLSEVYGPEPAVLRERAGAVVRTLNRFLGDFGDRPCAVFRAPARISLNPHCDHQGAWVPYGLHLRELLSVVAPAEDDRVEITNLDPQFAPRLAFSVEEEIARDREAWAADWFEYIEAPAVVEEVRRNLDAKTQARHRRGTMNYLKAGVLRLRHDFPQAEMPGLRMTLNGNIAQGGGQSSSSALVVTAALSLAQFEGIEIDRKLLAER